MSERDASECRDDEGLREKEPSSAEGLNFAAAVAASLALSSTSCFLLRRNCGTKEEDEMEEVGSSTAVAPLDEAWRSEKSANGVVLPAAVV